MSRWFGLVLLLAVVTFGCARKNAPAVVAEESASAVAANVASAPRVEVRGSAQNSASEKSAQQAPEQTPKPLAPAVSISLEQWIELLADARNLKRTPEETAAHFAQLGEFERIPVTSDHMGMRSKGSHHAIDVSFAQAQGEPWQPLSLHVELTAADNQTIKDLYKQAERALRKKLAKPIEVYKPAQKVFRVAGQQVVTLDERASEAGPIVYLELAEMQDSD
jgi:hypothetical protein